MSTDEERSDKVEGADVVEDLRGRERTGEWPGWIELAPRLATSVLQVRVSAALQALPRGRQVSPPGERFRQAILSAMPDIEAMELVERFFEVGAHVVGTGHPIAIFLAGCRECLAEREVQSAGWRVRTVLPEITTFADRPMIPGRQGTGSRRPLSRPASFAHMGNVAHVGKEMREGECRAPRRWPEAACPP